MQEGYVMGGVSTALPPTALPPQTPHPRTSALLWLHPTQDLVLHFITARFDERSGYWLVNLKEISKSYATKWLWVDVVRAGTGGGGRSRDPGACQSQLQPVTLDRRDAAPVYPRFPSCPLTWWGC